MDERERNSDGSLSSIAQLPHFGDSHMNPPRTRRRQRIGCSSGMLWAWDMMLEHHHHTEHSTTGIDIDCGHADSGHWWLLQWCFGRVKLLPDYTQYTAVRQFLLRLTMGQGNNGGNHSHPQPAQPNRNKTQQPTMVGQRFPFSRSGTGAVSSFYTLAFFVSLRSVSAWYLEAAISAPHHLPVGMWSIIYSWAEFLAKQNLSQNWLPFIHAPVI